MPRKTKDTKIEIKEDKIVEASIARPKSKTNSNSDAKKASSSKKGAAQTAKAKKSASETKKAKSTTAKKSTTSKKSSLNKKTTTKKKNGTAVSSKSKVKSVLEYYDLPYKYNETTVKILAQTPKKLFIYWDISEEDRKAYIDKFGPDFFNNTKPVLIVHNISMNYTFEVEINDFANCWYLDINDTKCEYSIELGRRSKIQNYYIPNNYVFVTSSNKIENPNDHILFEKQSNTIYFRNVKTNKTYSKNMANLSFIRNMGKIYNAYDVYKQLYNKLYSDEDIININNPTSTFK